MKASKDAYWSRWHEAYHEEFVKSIMPFWMDHGLDRKNGGVYTCLDRDGSLMDSTKSVWFQGRFGWMAAYAYNNVRRNKSWLGQKGQSLLYKINCICCVCIHTRTSFPLRRSL